MGLIGIMLLGIALKLLERWTDDRFNKSTR